MKFFKYFFIILGLLKGNFYELRNSTSILVSCKNENETYLANLYSKYINLFDSTEKYIIKNFEYYNFLYSSQVGLDIDRYSKGNLIEKTQCTFEKNSSYSINQISICPWKYQIKLRQDTFPFKRVSVKCTCNNCLMLDKNILNKNLYSCQPVIKIYPVLVKGKCQNGVYKWHPSIEYVNVACVCALFKMKQF